MLKCDDIALVEEIASQLIATQGKPSYSFGLSGSIPSLSWLDADGKPSNKTGIPFGLNNGQLVDIWVGGEILSTYQISIYYHYGNETGLTLLKTVVIPNTALTKIFTYADFGMVSVPKDCQIAARVGTVTGVPLPKNLGIHATIIGTR